jgi:hypothetical protein
MDLRLFFAVLGRFKLIVVPGVLVAGILAFFSFAKVEIDGGTPKLSLRGSELWASNARLLVATPGFSIGTDRPTPAQGEAEARLPALAAIYSSFVTSDPVRRIMLRQGPVKGLVEAAPLAAAPGSSSTLPVVNITAFDASETAAIQLARRAAAALQLYVRQQQHANRVKPERRIELRPMNAAFDPKLIEPRSKTLPIVIFLAVTITVLSLAFLLENLRPARTVTEVGPTPLGGMHRSEHEVSQPRDRANTA